MIDINLKVQNLLKTKKFYYSLKKNIKLKYWEKRKDPDGNIRDFIKNFNKEKKKYLSNNKTLIKMLNSIKYKSICDVGCGPGFLISSLKNKNIVAIDLDDSALKIASNFAEVYKKNLNTTFKLNKKFDLIICNHVIEHVKNPEILIKSINNILKKNGYLIIGTPDFDSAMARRYKNKYRMLKDKTHISLFSFESLLRFFDKKFKVIQIEFPYFDTEYFNKQNLLKIFNQKKVSPPFYGNFLLFLLKKID